MLKAFLCSRLSSIIVSQAFTRFSIFKMVAKMAVIFKMVTIVKVAVSPISLLLIIIMVIIMN